MLPSPATLFLMVQKEPPVVWYAKETYEQMNVLFQAWLLSSQAMGIQKLVYDHDHLSHCWVDSPWCIRIVTRHCSCENNLLFSLM